MGAATEDLPPVLHGRDEGATAVPAAVEQRLSELEQAFIRATNAGNEHATAHGKAAEAMKRSEGAAGTLSTGIVKLGEHYRMAGEGLSIFGLEADRAGVKLAALTDVVGALGEAAP